MIPVAFDLRDPIRSGIARVATSLARALAKQSRGRFGITLAGPGAQLEKLAADWGPDVSRIVDWSAGRYSLRAQVAWARVSRSVGESVWYFPHWDVPWHAFPERSIVTVHDLSQLVPGYAASHRRWAMRLWMRHAVGKSSRIVTDTEFSRRQILAEWPLTSERLDVVPCGVDEAFFTPAAERLTSLETADLRQPFMLSVGNLKRHKNLVIGVEVLARLPHVRWVVVGQWFPDWHEVDRRARELDVRDRIVYLGVQSDEALNALYHRAACLLFPSRHEGFGLPILEALAAGTPVVTANAGASVETLGDAGWICDADNSDQFAAAVSSALAAEPARKDRGRARARAFSWTSSAERLATVIEAVHAQS